MEDDLGYGIIGGDVKHIRPALRKQVDGSGCEAEQEEQQKSRQKIPVVPVGQAGGSAVKGDKDQQDMPQQPVEGQRPVRVHESRRLQESHDPTEKSESLEIDGGSLAASSTGKKRKSQA